MELSERSPQALTPAAACGERRQEVDGRAGARDSFVVEGAGLHPLGGGLRCGRELRGIEGLEPVAPAVQDSDVRPVELVGRAGEEVAADRADVHQRVGGIVDRVHEGERAGGAREARRHERRR